MTILSGGAGDDQLSGGNGYDTVNGGTGTNIIAFDRLRDTAEVGGGRDVVRQILDASSNSLVLGRTWVSPFTAQIGANARTAAATLNPTGLNVVRFGTAPASPAGTSATPKVINAIAQAPTFRPHADLDFIEGVDESTLAAEDQNAPLMMQLAMAAEPAEA